MVLRGAVMIVGVNGTEGSSDDLSPLSDLRISAHRVNGTEGSSGDSEA